MVVSMFIEQPPTPTRQRAVGLGRIVCIGMRTRMESEPKRGERQCAKCRTGAESRPNGVEAVFSPRLRLDLVVGTSRDTRARGLLLLLSFSPSIVFMQSFFANCRRK